MKKLIIISLFLACIFGGCSPKRIDTARIAVISDNKTEKVLFLDNENKVLAEKEIDFSQKFYYSKGIFYYSMDGQNYMGIDIHTLKEAEKLKNVCGSLIVYNDDDSYITYQNGQAYTVDSLGVQTPLQGYLCAYAYDDSYFYMLDYSNFLYIYDLSDFSLVKRERVNSSNYLNFAVINQNVYLVSDEGYTLINAKESNHTYLYPNDFKEILNNYGDLLFVKENKEQVVYRVSFTDLQMKLSVEYDEIYYREIVYQQDFSSFYQDGYEVIYYREIY
ncbi:MAG: hypothetical protein Q4C64_06845 [Erysipelotrichia bacterium]|nr:hypothetical protein [Erysipelotrichia bacterium]